MDPYFNIDEFDLMFEAFYGKDARFAKCEDTLQDLRNLCTVNGKSIHVPKLSTKEPNKVLEKQIADIFGFKDVMIHWDVSKVMVRSNYTLPTSHIIKGVKAIADGRIAEEGSIFSLSKHPYDESHTMVCVMDISQSLFEIMSNAEILAIMIHEIGHNFEVNPYAFIRDSLKMAATLLSIPKLLSLFAPKNIKEALTVAGLDESSVGKYLINAAATVIQNSSSIIWNVLSLDALKKVGLAMSNLWDYIVQRIPGMTSISNAFGYIARGITRWTQKYFAPLQALGLPLYVIASPIYHIASISTFKGEKFADSVAAAFGYGVPLSSALNKLEDYFLTNKTGDYYKNANGFQRFLYGLGRVNIEMLEMCMNDHGSAFQRTGNMLKMLEKDLASSDLDPEQKAALKIEIDSLRATYEKFISSSPEERSNLAIAMRSFINKHFGNDISIVDRLLPDLELK